MNKTYQDNFDKRKYEIKIMEEKDREGAGDNRGGDNEGRALGCGRGLDRMDGKSNT